MSDVRGIAAAYGVRVELADLGDWGSARLVAEYDPDGPVIRINENALPGALRQAHGDLSCGASTSSGHAARHAIDHAIAHELYHHREAIGEIDRITNRAVREAAADVFADTLTATGSVPAERASQPGSPSN